MAHLVRALQPVPSNSPSHELILGAQDIGPEEFLLNYAGPVDDPRIGPLEFLTYEFYSHFSQQWYITDFGVSFVFDPQTESTQRMVVGLGGGKIRNSIADYPKVRL